MPDRPSSIPQEADDAGLTPPEALVRSQRPHLVGVAGTGMNSLATLLLAMGKDVSGSDRADGPTLAWLATQGVRVQVGHEPGLVADADVVIRSAAVDDGSPEIVRARERNVPVMSHAEALGALMRAKRGVAVAGTHGKSTTTALIAHVLAVAGRDPTLVGGAFALDFGASSRLGSGPELVAEADEYGRRFLELHPGVAAITGIEPDHLDCYGSFEAVIEAFRQFVAGMPEDGVVVTNGDDPVLAALELPRRRLTYGTGPATDWRLTSFEPKVGGGARLGVARPDGTAWSLSTRLTCRYNAMNALAAVAVAGELGVGASDVETALASFKGTRRRFETRARRGGVWVVDDYAHHPTAVRETLRGAREVHDGRLVAVFQPHTTHRTATLLDEFAAAFGAADRALLVPIFRPTGRDADERPVTSDDVVAWMAHPEASAVGSLDAAFDALVREELRPGTLIVVLGAGDVTSLADRLAAQLNVESEPPTASRCTSAIGAAP